MKPGTRSKPKLLFLLEKSALGTVKNTWKQRPYLLKNAAELGKGQAGRVAPMARRGRQACRDHWEHAIIYLDAVEKECLGSAAVVTAGHEVRAGLYFELYMVHSYCAVMILTGRKYNRRWGINIE